MIVANNKLYLGCDRLNSIKCIFLCEFHHTVGAKIRCQIPENYISKEIFDLINVYIIPKPQMQRSIITVNTLGYKVVGYPIRLENHQRYARNAFYFNICFLVDSHRRSIQLESVCKKIANYFVMMEDEIGFLSKEENTPRIKNMFTKILKDLNEKRMSTIVEGETTIYLKVVNLQADPPPVYDWQVPILKPEYDDMLLDSWDLTSQQVLPHINGINHVARIASLSGVENALVKACIQNLFYYNIVQLLPLFKYCNVYMCTRNLQNLTKDEKLGIECMNFVKLKAECPAPTLHRILQIYSQMTHGVNLRALCQRLCPRDFNIDERKLVTFGLQKNLIRCINKYPIFIGSLPVGRQKLYTGKNSLDMICCITGLSAAKIEEDIDADTNVTVIWK